MTHLCAHCIRERADCQLVDYDGRSVWICGDCEYGEIRGGRYAYVEQREQYVASGSSMVRGTGGGCRRRGGAS